MRIILIAMGIVLMAIARFRSALKIRSIKRAGWRSKNASRVCNRDRGTSILTRTLREVGPKESQHEHQDHFTVAGGHSVAARIIQHGLCPKLEFAKSTRATDPRERLGAWPTWSFG